MGGVWVIRVDPSSVAWYHSHNGESSRSHETGLVFERMD